MRTTLLAGTIAAALLLGCDSGSPDSGGNFTIRATLDGQPWLADTMVAIAYAAPTNTSIIISAARRASLTEEQQITVAVQGFGRLGQYALVDTAPGIRAFSSVQVSGNVVTGDPVTWLSDRGTPGLLTITSISRGDSLVSGSFAFEASTHPDTAVHRHVSGTFRVRYSMQTVYLPSPARM
jgi:hypothetical protein